MPAGRRADNVARVAPRLADSLWVVLRKAFAIDPGVLHRFDMSSPLALIFYESLLIGNQLMNRLQDLGYRVVVLSDLTKLTEQAAETRPLVFTPRCHRGVASHCKNRGGPTRLSLETALPVAS